MDNMQPWNQMGQGYRNGQGYFQQHQFNRKQQPDLSQQMEWIGGISRDEKLEAKRLAMEASFSFEGYQVVRREFISHQFDPAMTIRGTSITFNNACISKLEDATYIHFLINPSEMKLLIRAVDEGARDAVRWCVVKGEKRKSRQITCKPFTSKLYEMMNWDPMYRYKMQGMKIHYMGEAMYLFDLTAVERFLPQHRDPVTGKRMRSQAVLPEEWETGYGMSVEDHEASTRVDLSSGYTSPSLLEDGIDSRDTVLWPQPEPLTDEEEEKQRGVFG